MATSFTSDKKRVEVRGCQGVDADGNKELNGKIVCGAIDITSYTTNGETLRAHNFGLAEIYGVIFGSLKQDAASVYAPTPASNLLSVVLNVWDAATPSEEGNTDDLQETAFVAWGKALGDSD